MQPGLNVHHLELFYYVARAGGITAALKLIPYGIQQPAVSLQMAQLEGSIGKQLFHRKPFQLTPTGREIYEFIAPFFGGLPQLAASVHGRAEQHLRVAATANVIRDHFPGLLRELQRNVPGLRISLRDVPLEGAARLLREHQVDIALELHADGIPPGLRCERLLKLPMVLLVPARESFANAGAVFRAVKAERVRLIAPPMDDVLTREFMSGLGKKGIDWEVCIEAPGLDLVEAYVAEGFGVGLTLAVPGRAKSAHVRALPLREFPQMNYSAFWNDRLSGLAQTCLEKIRTMAASL